MITATQTVENITITATQSGISVYLQPVLVVMGDIDGGIL
jgi:hypothetical protein